MDTDRFASGAKKELRKRGGILRGDRIGFLSTSPIRTFALRIFISSVCEKRRDVTFAESPADASLLLSDASLDSVSSGILDAVLAGTVAEYFAKSPDVRTAAPLSVWTDSEIYAYACAHGWHGAPEPAVSETARFLDTFSASRPGTKFAVKHAGEYLSKQLTEN